MFMEQEGTKYSVQMLIERKTNRHNLYNVSRHDKTSEITRKLSSSNMKQLFIPPPNEVGGGYTGFTLSVCPSVRPSVRMSVDNMVSGA